MAQARKCCAWKAPSESEILEPRESSPPGTSSPRTRTSSSPVPARTVSSARSTMGILASSPSGCTTACRKAPSRRSWASRLPPDTSEGGALLDEPGPERLRDRVGPRRHAEPLVETLDVRLHGLDREAEFVSDLAVAESPRQHHQHLACPRTQGNLFRRRGLRVRRKRLPDGGVEDDVPAGNHADGLEDLLDGGRLEDVGLRAGLDGLRDRVG